MYALTKIGLEKNPVCDSSRTIQSSFSGHFCKTNPRATMFEEFKYYLIPPNSLPMSIVFFSYYQLPEANLLTHHPWEDLGVGLHSNFKKQSFADVLSKCS